MNRGRAPYGRTATDGADAYAARSLAGSVASPWISPQRDEQVVDQPPVLERAARHHVHDAVEPFVLGRVQLLQAQKLFEGDARDLLGGTHAPRTLADGPSSGQSAKNFSLTSALIGQV